MTYNNRTDHDYTLNNLAVAVIESRYTASGFYEYQDQIVQHIQRLELVTQPNSEMIAAQPEIRWDLRPLLIDFVIDYHLTLRLSDESLYLAVNIIDRYCSKRVVLKRHYQLVGSTALWIASKYYDGKKKHSIFEKLSNMHKNTYTVNMFKEMELHILNSLGWDLSHPTFVLFIDIYLKQNTYKRLNLPLLKRLTLYLCEVTLYHPEYLDIVPSQIAKWAVTLANYIIYGDSYSINQNMYEQNIKESLLNHALKPSECLKQKYTRDEFYNSYGYIKLYQQQEKGRLQAQDLQRKRISQTEFKIYSPPPTDDEE